jgi:aquaporin Z
VVGAIAAAALLYVIASGAAGFDVSKGFASNGYEAHSPGQYSLVACFIMEVVMTMMFLFIIMGATHGKAPAGFAPLAIGLALVMIHLVSIPVTNTSVNPARSTGPALFVGGWALAQLWLFWVGAIDRRRAGRGDLSLAQRRAGRRRRGPHAGVIRRAAMFRVATAATLG